MSIPVVTVKVYTAWWLRPAVYALVVPWLLGVPDKTIGKAVAWMVEHGGVKVR